MFSHICVGSNDLPRSKIFYDAVFAALGASPMISDPAAGRLAWIKDGLNFMVVSPINGEAACVANGGTIGFRCDSAETVDAWHRAGCAAGGASCEDPPGLREYDFGKLYLAYLRDPDGNKLCAMHVAG